ncbi:MAG: hypothetical protein DMF56_27650 [Acidobacteria bacterium]|nr:MAG: hypothetical protein DMF56_27650 [Acidobacteriota bacterium]
MFRVVVLAENEHRVECGYCRQKEYIRGPFVLGIQTPASMEHAMQWHHLALPMSRALFTSYQPCPAMAEWKPGRWEVVDRDLTVISQGTYEMVEGDPVVDPSIQGKVGGIDWDTRRVEQLARMEVGASSFPGRTWHMGPSGGNVRVNLRRKDGKYESVIIPLEDIHVVMVSDEEIRRTIQTRLLALDEQGQ